MAPMMSTASRTTASLREEKKRKTLLRCQLGREVEEGAAIVVSGHFPREVRHVQRESSLLRSPFLLVLVLVLGRKQNRGRARGRLRSGKRVLPAFVQRHAESLEMTGETARVERIRRLYVLEKLIEFGVNFRGHTAFLAERVGQPGHCENKTFRALCEQVVWRPFLDKLRVHRSQRGEHGSSGALAPVGDRSAAGQRIGLVLHSSELRQAGTV